MDDKDTTTTICRQFTNGEINNLLDRLDRLTRERDEARTERDSMREEIVRLRACVSGHLHGNGQTLANAYAALRRFDQKRRADAIEAVEHDK